MQDSFLIKSWATVFQYIDGFDFFKSYVVLVKPQTPAMGFKCLKLLINSFMAFLFSILCFSFQNQILCIPACSPILQNHLVPDHFHLNIPLKNVVQSGSFCKVVKMLLLLRPAQNVNELFHVIESFIYTFVWLQFKQTPCCIIFGHL